MTDGEGRFSDTVEGNVTSWLANTALPLSTLAGILDDELQDALAPLHQRWAFTRHDVVAHSQGGLLTRMLASELPPAEFVPRGGFRNPSNHFRGRFHRAITIGSPHNGARLVRYLIRLDETGRSDWFEPTRMPRALWRYGFTAGVMAQLAPALIAQPSVGLGIVRDKFDPAGSQIQELNDPSLFAPWTPDAEAKFHLVRTTVNQRQAPSATSSSFGHFLLGLDGPRGSIVLPRGSDGVVDWDSMGAHGESEVPSPNVSALASNLEISHSPPEAIFARDPNNVDVLGQTNAGAVAAHVRRVLTQEQTDAVFGPFPVPGRLSDATINAINAAADGAEVVDAGAVASIEVAPIQNVQRLQSPRVASVKAEPVPGRSINGKMRWFVELFGPGGVTLDYVDVIPDSLDSTQATVFAADEAVGDVVVYASYKDSNDVTIRLKPLTALSLPPVGSSLSSIAITPSTVTLTANGGIQPILTVTYDSGIVSQRPILVGDLEVNSSNDQVVDVSNIASWRAKEVGHAMVTVTYQNFSTTASVHVIDSSVLSAKSFDEWKGAHFSAPELNDLAITGTDSDHDRDGLSLFAEYLGASSPKMLDGMSPITLGGVGDDHVFIDLHLSSTAAGYRVLLEESADLERWAPTYEFDPANPVMINSSGVLAGFKWLGDAYQIRLNLNKASYYRLVAEP